MIETRIKLKDYVVIDIENPNTKADSICSIAIIQVSDNKVIYKESILINPEDRFDDINMRVNKITPNMVKDAITFDKFWDKIKDIVINNVIIGHGVKFDLSVITKALLKYSIEVPTIKMVCTQHLSQKYLETNQYKLDNVCEFLDIDLKEHHNALSDTIACKGIFDYINNNFGLEVSDIEEYNYVENRKHSNGMKIAYSDDTKSLQSLKRIIEKILIDDKIGKEEIGYLNEWLNDNIQLSGNYPYDKIYNSVKMILEDGTVSEEEYNELSQVFNDFINPIKDNGEENVIFKDQLFCLTGTFNFGAKEDIEKSIIEKGGICSKGISGKVNYLVVGGSGSDAWKFGNYGGKVQKAMELNEKGKNIKIVSEDDFLKALKK